MAFTPPIAADLKARYPEFAAVADARITAVLDEIALEVDATWIEDHRRPAMLALAAHLLAMEGALSNNQSAGASGPGAVIREKVGDVEVAYANPSASSQSATGSEARYGQTHYGRRFLEYRQRSFPTVAVV